jgi:hypothetical protein
MARLGEEAQGVYEKFIPLIVTKVIESRFNPESVSEKAWNG